MHKWYASNVSIFYNILIYRRLAEACDNLLQVEKLIAVSLTLWTQPPVSLVLSRYQPCLVWILVKLLMVSTPNPSNSREIFMAETDASISDLTAKAGSVSSTPVKSDCIPDPTSITYLDYDDPFAMVDSFSGAPYISRLSPNAWVGCGSNIYVLECLGKGYIRIEPNLEGEGEFRYINWGQNAYQTCSVLPCHIHRGDYAFFLR